MAMTNNTTVGNVLSVQNHQPTVVPNYSIPDGCVKIRFSADEDLPWEDPGNIVNAEIEGIVRRFKDNALAVLFLFGVPANIINMMVFYKQGLKDRVNLCLFALSVADGIHLTQAMIFYGEHLILQFTTEEVYGSVRASMANYNLVGLFGFQWVSQILSAIVACERCLCIFNPLKFRMMLQTRTMAVVIIAVYILVVGFFFLVAFRYRVGCAYDPVSGSVVKEPVIGEFYKSHTELINYLDSFVYGAGIPGMAIIVVITTTLLTAVKLRQIVAWRTGASSSISASEVDLTKMLIGNSLFFIACVTPIGLFRVVCPFLPDMNIGRRHQYFYQSGMWILELLSFINATFNIFVYYSMGSRYREMFWSLFNPRNKLDKIKIASK